MAARGRLRRRPRVGGCRGWRLAGSRRCFARGEPHFIVMLTCRTKNLKYSAEPITVGESHDERGESLHRQQCLASHGCHLLFLLRGNCGLQCIFVFLPPYRSLLLTFITRQTLFIIKCTPPYQIHPPFFCQPRVCARKGDV